FWVHIFKKIFLYLPLLILNPNLDKMRKIVAIVLLLLFPLITMAQGPPPPPPPPPPGLPIDSGIVYLLLLGVAYGISKVKN
ncbi:hypothetical protein N9M81_02530, partial [Flavobacteriaceae bacterium]|nr:hypothetical protein [Flavobacteriaceae bacterium]